MTTTIGREHGTRLKTKPLALCAILSVAVAASANWSCADWPTHRGNNARTAFSDSDLAVQLTRLWCYSAPQPPRPAWPPPARGSYWQQLTSIEPRVIDDHVFHPVVAGGLLYFGSSADDTLRAVSIQSGQLVWQFTSDGPVRYAPSVAGSRILFGSDDGYVYCLNALDGRLAWRQRVGPTDRRIPGNGRIVSSWPIRTSVVADERAAYAFAGLFPAQGVYAAAIDVATGQLQRRHQIDASPQGYLLADDERLFVPMGRSNPSAYEKSTGRYLGDLPGEGGTFALIDERQFIAGGGNQGALVAADAVSRTRLARFQGRQMALGTEFSYLLGHRHLVALNRHGDDAENHGLTPHWQVAVENAQSVATCRNAVIVGGASEVLVLSPANGETRQRLTVEGRALGLAISDRKCFVSTDEGHVYCFGAGDQVAAKDNGPRPSGVRVAPRPAKSLAELLTGFEQHAGRLKRGYAVVLGTQAEELLRALIAETELNILVLSRHTSSALELREQLIAQGLYGSRIAVHVVQGTRWPLTSNFANLVVDRSRQARDSEEEADAAWSRTQARRLLRPSGGVAWLERDAPPWLKGTQAGAGAWTHLYGSPANTAYSGDNLIGDELQLQWFGGPGPQRMTDRHLRAPAPLVQQGLMIVPGENTFMGVDAFNGTELWELSVPASQRYSIPYDCGYYSLSEGEFAVAANAEVWLVDAADGTIKQRIALPKLNPRTASESDNARWGYLAIVDARIYGSSMKPTAARMTPSRQQIDLDYRNDQPLVTSDCFFCLDRESRSLRWSHRACILHSTICVTDDAVCFVESSTPEMLDHQSGRVPLTEILAAGARLVCLDADTGQERWSQQLPTEIEACTNVLYVQANSSALVVAGSLTQSNDTVYRLAVFEPATGLLRWQAEHHEGKPGAFTHGEQVHHPVLMPARILAEPVMYSLDDGTRLAPDGRPEEWRLMRPGHSCGTISGASNCVFFRANNPTMMSLSAGLSATQRMQKLAPSRPGCWINIVPADGLVLIPEASASCVCLYPLQTSMAFAPAEEVD